MKRIISRRRTRTALATLVAATAAFAAGPNGKTLYRYTGELTAKTVATP